MGGAANDKKARGPGRLLQNSGTLAQRSLRRT